MAGARHTSAAALRPFRTFGPPSANGSFDPEGDIHGGLSAPRNRSLVQVLLHGWDWPMSDRLLSAC